MIKPPQDNPSESVLPLMIGIKAKNIEKIGL